MGGRGGAGQKPTNARQIEYMNEAQIDKEIRKEKSKIKSAENAMRRNDITQTAQNKALREDFPLGPGGGRMKEYSKRMSSDSKMAAKYVEAAKKRDSAETRIKALEKAKSIVKGTGKTESQIISERKKSIIASTPKTMSWKTTQKGGWTKDGGYMPKIIKSGNYEIHGSSGLYSIHEDGKKIWSTSKLSEAKTYVERRRKKKK